MNGSELQLAFREAGLIVRESVLLTEVFDLGKTGWEGVAKEAEKMQQLMRMVSKGVSEIGKREVKNKCNVSRTCMRMLGVCSRLWHFVKQCLSLFHTPPNTTPTTPLF